MENDIKYANAMAELLHYLKGIRKEDIDKIPTRIMKFFKNNASIDLKCDFDYTKPLNELNLLEETKGLIAMLCLNYWCETEEQKQNFVSKLKNNERKLQNELAEKCNVNNIFINKRHKIDNNKTMNIQNVSYIKAYTEVNCLLKYLPQLYIDKLPKEFVDFIKKQSDEQYNINIDTNKSLLEQNFSKKTKDLIAVIKYNYWSTDEEKKQLKQMFCKNENNYQKELAEKYNPNDIFKKRKTKIEMPQEEVIEKDVQMVVYKENIFIRFFNKIKNIFRR